MLMDMRKKSVGQKAGREKQKQGFTLTEIAIVLGIIGLILGAIWVAAAAVYTNMRTSKTTTELLDIVQNVRAMYATSGAVDNNADMTFASGAQATKGLTYIQGGVFPADMIIAAGTGVQDPWAGYVSVVAATNVTANDAFSVQFDNVPTQACINVISSSTGTGRDPGLFSVATAAAGTAPATAGGSAPPVAPATAQGLCVVGGAGKNVSMGFSFRLK